jgi:Lrp/AsnC family leucine-responsive transcriptional regulator
VKINETTALEGNLDDADRILLNALQDDCQRPIAELAALAEISIPTCHRRLQRLRKSGLIEREGAIVDLMRTSRNVVIFVHVALERHDSTTHATFEKKMLRSPEISQCYNMSGETDYVVMMHVASIAEYHQLATQLFASDPNVRTFRSSIAIKRVKLDTRIKF